MMSVARPSILGPTTCIPTATTARTTIQKMWKFSSRRRTNVRFTADPKSRGRSTRLAELAGAELRCALRLPQRLGLDRRAIRLPWRRAPRSCRSCRRPPSELGLDDLLVGRTALQQLAVGADPHDPPALEDDDLVGVDDASTPVGPRGSPSPPRSMASAPPAGGRRWRGRGPRTSRRTGRSRAAAPGPGRSRAAGAGHPRRCRRPGRWVPPARPSPARSPRPGRRRAPPTSPRRSRRGRRSGGCWPRRR